MKVRRASVQTRSETGTRRYEALRHTRAVCRRAERRDCPPQPRIRACSRSFMNNAGQRRRRLFGIPVAEGNPSPLYSGLSGSSGWSGLSGYLVHRLIRLVWFNQINKTNQTNQLNETDQTDLQRCAISKDGAPQQGLRRNGATFFEASEISGTLNAPNQLEYRVLL